MMNSFSFRLLESGSLGSVSGLGGTEAAVASLLPVCFCGLTADYSHRPRWDTDRGVSSAKGRAGPRGFILMKGCEDESGPNERPSRDQRLPSVIRKS